MDTNADDDMERQLARLSCACCALVTTIVDGPTAPWRDADYAALEARVLAHIDLERVAAQRVATFSSQQRVARQWITIGGKTYRVVWQGPDDVVLAYEDDSEFAVVNAEAWERLGTPHTAIGRATDYAAGVLHAAPQPCRAAAGPGPTQQAPRWHCTPCTHARPLPHAGHLEYG